MMSMDRSRPAERPAPSRAAERLFALSLISMLVLLSLIAIVGVYARTRIAQNATTLTQHAEAINALRQEVAELRSEVQAVLARDREFDAPAVGRTPPRATEPLATQASGSRTDQAAAEPPRSGATDPAAIPNTDERAAQSEPTPPRRGSRIPAADSADTRIRALLARAAPADAGGETLADPEAARGALQAALGVANPSELPADVWGELALVAHLVDRNDEATLFAQRAERGGAPPLRYYLRAGREQLDAGDALQAALFAEQIRKAAPHDARGALLLARALLARREYWEARAVVRSIGNVEMFGPRERLRYAELLDQFGFSARLNTLLDAFASVPDGLNASYQRLHARAAIARGDYVAALGIVAALLAERPDDYELRTLRGEILSRGGEHAAAADALAFATDTPARPEALHWLGVATLALGEEQAAAQHFNAALAADPAFAPSWEASATMALNRNDLATAIEALLLATRANPLRAQSQFLLALAYAKADNAEQARSALAAALRLDPQLADTARQSAALVEAVPVPDIDALEAEARMQHDGDAAAQ